LRYELAGRVVGSVVVTVVGSVVVTVVGRPLVLELRHLFLNYSCALSPLLVYATCSATCILPIGQSQAHEVRGDTRYMCSLVYPRTSHIRYQVTPGHQVHPYSRTCILDRCILSYIYTGNTWCNARNGMRCSICCSILTQGMACVATCLSRLPCLIH